jgi:AraC-like DNA-binding protein
MQNRPQTTHKLGFVPVELSQDFPIWTGGLFEQTDQPIKQLHIHDCLEIGYCYDGSGIFVVENKVLPYTAGDVCVVTRHEMHLAQSIAGSTSPWAFLFVRPLELLEADNEEQASLQSDHLRGDRFCNVISGRQHPEISQLVQDLLDEVQQPGPGHRPLVRGLMSAFLVRLNRIYSPPKKLYGVDRHTLEQISPALELIFRHFPRNLSVPELAEACKKSVTHFRRLFQAAMGISPQEYLIQFRIKLAGRLLKSTSRSILDIALSVGYPTLSSFNRHFKRVTGSTPRSFRSIE